MSGFNSSSLALAGFTQPLTMRGYTGHEMLDDHGLIHMNGRIFDPKLARFLQADPYIQAATDTQSYNRYTYVRNNPLNATDPSGYFWNFVIAAVVSYAAGDYAKRHNIGWLASVATIAGCATMNAAVCGGASFGSTYGATGNLGLAFVAGVAGAAMSGMPVATMAEKATRVLAGSMLAGGAGLISGGEFGHGVISAGIGSMTGYIFGDGLEGFAAATIVGGTMTEMTGGKFANGAATAAFSYAMSWAAQKYGIGGVSQTGDTDETGRTKEQEQLDRLKFESEIAQLRKDGKLCVDCAVYNSPDDAAKAVLNQTSGLSEQYQLEVSGSIYKQGDKWAYSVPKVGGYGSAPLTTDMIGYHTHPDGSLAFSNRWNSHGGSGSGDAGWVAKSQKTLYLGVKIGNKIAIGTCDYGNCSEWVVGRGPTQPSRVLQ